MNSSPPPFFTKPSMFPLCTRRFTFLHRPHFLSLPTSLSPSRPFPPPPSVPSSATSPAYLEEGHGGRADASAVLYLCLFGEVLGRLYGGNHPLHGKERSQVGRVGRDDDQREEPPDSAYDACTDCSGIDICLKKYLYNFWI